MNKFISIISAVFAASVSTTLAVGNEHECCCNPTLKELSAGVLMSRSIASDDFLFGVFVNGKYSTAKCNGSYFKASARYAYGQTDSFDYGLLGAEGRHSVSGGILYRTSISEGTPPGERVGLFTDSKRGLKLSSLEIVSSMGFMNCWASEASIARKKSGKCCLCNHYGLSASTIYTRDTFSIKKRYTKAEILPMSSVDTIAKNVNPAAVGHTPTPVVAAKELLRKAISGETEGIITAAKDLFKQGTAIIASTPAEADSCWISSTSKDVGMGAEAFLQWTTYKGNITIYPTVGFWLQVWNESSVYGYNSGVNSVIATPSAGNMFVDPFGMNAVAAAGVFAPSEVYYTPVSGKRILVKRKIFKPIIRFEIPMVLRASKSYEFIFKLGGAWTNRVLDSYDNIAGMDGLMIENRFEGSAAIGVTYNTF